MMIYNQTFNSSFHQKIGKMQYNYCKKEYI